MLSEKAKPTAPVAAAHCAIKARRRLQTWGLLFLRLWDDYYLDVTWQTIGAPLEEVAKMAERLYRSLKVVGTGGACLPSEEHHYENFLYTSRTRRIESVPL